MSNRQMLAGKCVACGDEMMGFYDGDAPSWAVLAEVCAACARHIPESLLKATHDEFDYAIGLRTGDVFRFRRATLAGDFVHLDDVVEWDYIDSADSAYTLDRGVDIRLSDVVWCADAPRGS